MTLILCFFSFAVGVLLGRFDREVEWAEPSYSSRGSQQPKMPLTLPPVAQPRNNAPPDKPKPKP